MKTTALILFIVMYVLMIFKPKYRPAYALVTALVFLIVGILPCDVVSLYLGNTRLPFGKYLLGGVLGFLPDILTATVVGMKADDRSSPWFWGAIAVNLLVAAGSTLFYTWYRRRAAAGPDDDAGEPIEPQP